MNKLEKDWTCGVCNIITHGEWDAEVKPKDKPDSDWLPVCKLCAVDVREDFIPDEE